jgi:hypothetical protein
MKRAYVCSQSINAKKAWAVHCTVMRPLACTILRPISRYRGALCLFLLYIQFIQVNRLITG